MPAEECKELKLKVINYFLEAAKLAESVKQTQMLFNGAIHIWNEFIEIFRDEANDVKLLPEITDILQ